MAWPPPPIAADKAPGPPDDEFEHPDHHNELANAINDTVTEFTSGPTGLKIAGIEAGAQVNTVDSVNGATGVVVLNADDIDDTSTTNKFATAAQLSAVDGLATTYQPLDADLSTLAAGNIPTNLNESLASQYVALPETEGTVGQAVKIASLDPLVTEWGDASGGSSAAADVTITDTAELYAATNVEEALAEVAADVAAIAGGFESVWIRAQSPDMVASVGTPAASVVGSGSQSAVYWPVLRFDAAAQESVRGSVMPPAGWSTFDVDVYYTAVADPTTGDVVWRFQHTSRAPGDSLTSGGYTTETDVTDTIDGWLLMSSARVASGLTTTPNEPFLFQLSRMGADAADTVTTDAAVIGIRLKRAT
jgi:hypothetical protein